VAGEMEPSADTILFRDQPSSVYMRSKRSISNISLPAAFAIFTGATASPAYEASRMATN